MRQEFERVYLETDGKVALVALNHPQHVNALSEAMVRDLHAALDHVEAGDFRALVLTAEGRGFCSGADLTELPARQAEGAGATLQRLYEPLLRRLRDFPMPIVTAVNGAAVGIGFSLALMGDLVVAARSASFLLSFARIGLVPDGGVTWLLPRLVGLARARELALLAEPLGAEQALAWGLINRVSEDESLRDDALLLAARLAAGPAALEPTRRLFWQSPENSYEEQLGAERAAQQAASATDDFREGIAAFFEKRPPRFKGR